jgi:hypothetical protein
MRNVILKASSVFMLLFGLVSLFMTTSIIFDLFQIRKMEGHYVSFIVYVNFICAIIYLIAAYGFLKEKKSTTIYLFVAGSILVIAFIVFLIYISRGGIYETKTVKAMSVRILITIAFTGISWNYLSRKGKVIV